MTTAGGGAVRGDAVRGNLAALVCMLLWATNFPVADALLDTWSPLALTAARLAIGGAVIALAALAVRQRATLARLLSSPAVALAALFQIGSTLLFMIGQTKVDPVVAAVIVSSMPVITVIVGWLSGEERLGRSGNIELVHQPPRLGPWTKETSDGKENNHSNCGTSDAGCLDGLGCVGDSSVNRQ